MVERRELSGADTEPIGGCEARDRERGAVENGEQVGEHTVGPDGDGLLQLAFGRLCHRISVGSCAAPVTWRATPHIRRGDLTVQVSRAPVSWRFKSFLACRGRSLITAVGFGPYASFLEKLDLPARDVLSILGVPVGRTVQVNVLRVDGLLVDELVLLGG